MSKSFICKICGLDCEDEELYKKHMEVAELGIMDLYVKKIT